MSTMEELNRYGHIVKYICDICEHTCWFNTNSTPKGWCTTRDDHSDTICPDCNPWKRHVLNPDNEKLKRIKEANIPFRY